jgi:hypothetical protein
MLDKHFTPEQAMRAAVQCSASEQVQEWARRMGKGVDDTIHAKAAYTYSDVAGEQWKTCLNHGDREVPVHILIMGLTVKLGHTTSAEGFRKIMLEKFGFAAEKEESDLIVRFFEDSFEDIPGAVGNLMETLMSVKNQLGGKAASTFICFTGRHFTAEEQYRLQREASLSGRNYTNGWARTPTKDVTSQNQPL